MPPDRLHPYPRRIRALLVSLVLIPGVFLVALSIGPFRAALREHGDTPDGLMVGYGVILLILGLAILWGGWRALRR